MYTTWWANSCTIIVCCEGMHHMLTDAFWILPLLMRKSLFLSLEVPIQVLRTVDIDKKQIWSPLLPPSRIQTSRNKNFSNLQRPRKWGPSYACILGYVFTPGALQHVPYAYCIISFSQFVYRVASGVSNIIDHTLTKRPIIDRFLFFQLFLSLL